MCAVLKSLPEKTVYEPNGKDGYVQHLQLLPEQQSEEAPTKSKHKRQRRIEDWFPN